MYEADSRTGRHDFSIWALYFDLILEKLRPLLGWAFSQEWFSMNHAVYLAISTSMPSKLYYLRVLLRVRTHLSYRYAKDQNAI